MSTQLNSYHLNIISSCLYRVPVSKLEDCHRDGGVILQLAVCQLAIQKLKELKENNPTEYRIFQTKMRAYPEQLSFVKYFFKFCRDPDRIKNFLIATKQNHLEEAERFLKEGIFVDVRHSLNGPTPLVQALQDENIPMAMLLVEYGAKLNVQCNVNQAPLFVACQKNLAGMAAFLLGKGAEVDIRNRDGLTALHITSELNQKNSLIYC